MDKKTFGLIGAGIFVIGVISGLLFVVPNRSPAEFTALSDKAMASLTGGIDGKYKWDVPRVRHWSGEWANCDYSTNPQCLPTQSQPCEYEPDIYWCEECWSGDLEYYAFPIFRKYYTWCFFAGPEECGYDYQTWCEEEDCQFKNGTTC